MSLGQSPVECHSQFIQSRCNILLCYALLPTAKGIKGSLFHDLHQLGKLSCGLDGILQDALFQKLRVYPLQYNICVKLPSCHMPFTISLPDGHLQESHIAGKGMPDILILRIKGQRNGKGINHKAVRLDEKLIVLIKEVLRLLASGQFIQIVYNYHQLLSRFILDIHYHPVKSLDEVADFLVQLSPQALPGLCLPAQFECDDLAP